MEITDEYILEEDVTVDFGSSSVKFSSFVEV